MVVTPVILSTSVLGYITAVMTDQVTKPQQADGTAANVRPALLFFYSISTIIFIGSVIVALSYVIWTTVQLVKHLKAASMGAGLQLQQTTRTAIRKVITIVTLVSVIAAFMCLMELIALIGGKCLIANEKFKIFHHIRVVKFIRVFCCHFFDWKGFGYMDLYCWIVFVIWSIE